MANITINEISQNYTYNVGNNSYATVAFPITASWGPGFIDSPEEGGSTEAPIGYAEDDKLESVIWTRFKSNQEGLESFVSTFRGPASRAIHRQDYSYQVALTLLTSGYDILVCRVATGAKATQKFHFATRSGEKPEYTYEKSDYYLTINAKYPGSFGSNLVCDVRKLERVGANSTSGTKKYVYWNCVIYIEHADSPGIRTAVENLNFVLDLDNATDYIPHISEVESKFVDFVITHIPDTPIEDGSTIDDGYFVDEVCVDPAKDETTQNTNRRFDKVSKILSVYLNGGSDDYAYADTEADLKTQATNLAKYRYHWSNTSYETTLTSDDANYEYIKHINDLAITGDNQVSKIKLRNIVQREWTFNAAYTALGALKDKLAYNPNRVIVPCWDDQDYWYLDGDSTKYYDINVISPLHARLQEVAYLSRCATAYIDIPRSISRKFIYNEVEDNEDGTEWAGYSQRLARWVAPGLIVSGTIYASHAALFAPWGKYTYVGTGKQAIISPSVLALLIDRAMIKNQTSQYEWQLPTVRRHNLRIGRMDYTISKKYLDIWQSLDGVSLNCITQIPDLGLSIWGNSTLFEVPPATYQAMANLSTRKLVNAIEDLAYRCGISITFQYNNEQAYNAFYAGMTPLLDTMRNVGAIEDYYLRMAEDVNGLDNVNANSVIGKIYLVIDGVINDINIDLIALPPQTSLDQYRV